MKFDRGTQPTYTDSINPMFDDFSIQPQDEGQLNYTHIFSPTVVNNFIFSDLYYSAIFGNLNPGPALTLFPGNIAFPVDGSLTALGTGSGTRGVSLRVSCTRKGAMLSSGGWSTTFLSREEITVSRWA